MQNESGVGAHAGGLVEDRRARRVRLPRPRSRPRPPHARAPQGRGAARRRRARARELGERAVSPGGKKSAASPSDSRCAGQVAEHERRPAGRSLDRGEPESLGERRQGDHGGVRCRGQARVSSGTKPGSRTRSASPCAAIRSRTCPPPTGTLGLEIADEHERRRVAQPLRRRRVARRPASRRSCAG